MIRIAIDGPGGAGKSSVAKAVAKQLGIIYVDTGALYRNIGLYMLEAGVNPKNPADVVPLLDGLTLELKFENGKQVILLNGVDRGDEIRTPEVSMAASDVSAIPAVREYLLAMQRDTAKKNSLIMDGRDIGTVILPDAEVKIFLIASAEARAKRRYLELQSKGVEITYEQVFNEMVERDKNDSTREIAPCVPAEDAVILDNSDLNFEETTLAVLKIIKKLGKPKSNFYSRAKVIVAPLYRFFMRVKATGVENVPKDGGVILCSNHIAAVDVISIGSVCPRQLTFVAKKELFSVPVLGKIVKALGAIPVDRGANDVSAIRSSVTAAEEGKVLSIFPQGHRYPGVDPASTPTHNGAALIAYHSKCDVIPVCIDIKGGKYGFGRRVNVIFGKRIKYEDLRFINGGLDEYKAATAKIFNEINALADFSQLPPYTPESRIPAKRKKRNK